MSPITTMALSRPRTTPCNMTSKGTGKTIIWNANTAAAGQAAAAIERADVVLTLSPDPRSVRPSRLDDVKRPPGHILVQRPDLINPKLPAVTSGPKADAAEGSGPWAPAPAGA